MPTHSLKPLLRVLLAVASALACSQAASGRDACVGEADVKAMVARLNSPPGAGPNEKLRKTLLKLKEKYQERVQNTIAEGRKDEAMAERVKAAREKNTAALCPILKEFGWPVAGLVGQDGAAAAFYLLRNSSSFELQRDLLPVVVAATKAGEITRSDFATYYDRLRLNVGLKQLFGTQAGIANGFLVLYPIENHERVDERRKQYGLEPLADYVRTLERIYRLPLVKSPGSLTNSFADGAGAALARSAGRLFEGGAEEDEVVRVETNLVSLHVSVYSDRLKAHVSTLGREDFAVFEDGREEAVTFFAATDVPFDLVLLLDLSGSTAGKRDLIRKTTRRFVEAARPGDRLAVVTFSDTVSVVSPLTDDRRRLLESVERIEGAGGSNVWDALKFTLDEVLGAKAADRRRAVVMMTDGADNALMGFVGGRGSKIQFGDLLEAVRQTDALVIPVYLDTEGDHPFLRRIYESARNTLSALADESGGLYYKARKLEDLEGVYGQVIEDLGKVYSLGYRPTNAKRDGLWRQVSVRVRNRPELSARARPGYYAK